MVGGASASSRYARLRALARLGLLAAALAATAQGFRGHLSGQEPWTSWVGWWLVGWASAIVGLPRPAPAARETLRRRVVRWAAGAAAAGGMLLVVRLAGRPGSEVAAAVVALAAGLAFLLFRATPLQDQTVFGKRAAKRGPGGPTTLRVARCGVPAVLGVGCAVTAVIVNPSHHLAGFLLWGLSLILFAAAFLPARETSDAEASGRNRERRVLLLFLALLLAAALRFPLLDRNPASINPDEGRLGRWAERIWKEGFPNAFDLGWNAFPHLSYMTGYAWVPLTGTSNPSLRRASATVGVLSLLPVFWWARRWWGETVAIAALLILAVNQTHVVWSRMAFNNIQQVLVAGLLLAAVARALRRGRLADWVLAGYAGGLCFHTYHAAKLFPFLLLGLVVVAAAAAGVRCRMRRVLPRAAVCLAAFVLCLGPLLRTSWERWDFLYRNISNRGDMQRLIAAYEAADFPQVRWWIHSHVYGCAFSLFSYPRRDLAILDPFIAVPFLLGLGWMLWHWRDPRHGIVLGWFAGILVVGGMLTDYPPAVTRMLGFLPAVAVVPAVLAGMFRRLCRDLWPNGGDRIAVPVLAAWLAASAWSGWRTVFVDGHPARFRDPMTEICRVIESAPRPGALYMVGGWIMEEPTVAAHDCMMAPDPELRLINLSEDARVVPLPPDHTGHAVILVSRRQRELARSVEDAYPGARGTVIRDGEGRFLFERFDIDETDIRTSRGLIVVEERAGRLESHVGVSEIGSARAGDALVAIHASGAVLIPEPGEYGWRAGSLGVRIGTRRVDPEKFVWLPAGWQQVRLDGDLSPTSGTVRLEWRTPDRPWQAVPREHLFIRLPRGQLLGRYFASALPLRGNHPVSATPFLVRTEGAVSFDFHPQFDPLPAAPLAARPSTMEWVGEVFLRAGVAHEVRLESTTPAVLYVDGREVLRLEGAPEGQVSTAVIEGGARESDILLRAVRPADDPARGWKLRLLWRPVGGGWTATPEYRLPAVAFEPTAGSASGPGSAESHTGTREDAL